MNEKHHFLSFWKGKGFYAALTLVIAGAAAAGFFAVDSMIRTLDAKPDENSAKGEIPWQQPEIPAEEKKNDVPVKPVAPEISSGQPDVPPSSSAPSEPAPIAQKPRPASSVPAESAAEPPQEPLCFSLPLPDGSVRGFSGNELVYDETMRDWRTHNGMDFKAEKGSEVLAPVSAQVADVRTDPLWGGCVELQRDDLTMRVCGMDRIDVSIGETVTAGKIIGTAGEIPAESAMEPHIHLEMLRNGIYADPAECFAVKE